MLQTHEYDFIRVRIKGSLFSGNFNTQYQDTIREKARLGWRLIQCFAPSTGPYGTASYLDLIFEKTITT